MERPVNSASVFPPAFPVEVIAEQSKQRPGGKLDG
jgi:hypothetical protein